MAWPGLRGSRRDGRGKGAERNRCRLCSFPPLGTLRACDLPITRREPGLPEVKPGARATAASMTWTLEGLFHSPRATESPRAPPGPLKPLHPPKFTETSRGPGSPKTLKVSQGPQRPSSTPMMPQDPHDLPKGLKDPSRPSADSRCPRPFRLPNPFPNPRTQSLLKVFQAPQTLPNPPVPRTAPESLRPP